MQVNTIRIQTLGGFSVWVNDELIVKEAAKLTKPWQLFCYLVVNRDRFTDSRKLISAMWADDELSDPANVLKNAIYSLRKELCGGESSTESPIIYSTGGYRLDPAVKLDLDFDEFSALHDRIFTSQQEAAEVRMELCQQAMDLFGGDFLPQLDQDLWVIPVALGVRQKYLACVDEYCGLLFGKEQYKEMLDLAQTANQIDPLDEKTVVHLFRALEALHMFRVIVTTYSRVVQKFADTLDGRVPEDVQKIYHAASERINKTEQDIIVIKTELSGSEQGERPQRGAYFCTYTELKYICPMLKRTAERGGQNLMAALFTLQPLKGVEVSQDVITRAMAEFKVIAMGNLRKTDALSRYSKNQYVVLIAVKSLDDGRLVRDRIKESFAATSEKRITLDVKLTEV